MKIAIASDLHLEFGDLDFHNRDNADVLILSGDILIAADVMDRDTVGFMYPDSNSARYHGFMQRCCDRFANVLYVLGNHEHYHGDFAATADHLRQQFGYLGKLQILEKQTVTIGDVTFIGGTLWTDMNRSDPLTIFHMKKIMNDFRCVKNSGTAPDAKFLPEDAVQEHEDFVRYIDIITAGKNDQKFVVVGHHAPSRQSIHPRYAHDQLMNGGFSSELSDFILDRPQIRLWTHGHTHDAFDYRIGSTRVVCNPRGYIGYEVSADKWQLISVDI